MDIWDEPMSYKKGTAYLGAGFTIRPLNEDYIGALCVTNSKTDKMEQQIKNNASLWGGMMTTVDGPMFWGTLEGYPKVADAETGKELWQFQTGSGIVASPATWEDNGEQLVAVVSGWGGVASLWGGEVAKRVNLLEQGGSVWVSKLHKN